MRGFSLFSPWGKIKPFLNLFSSLSAEFLPCFIGRNIFGMYHLRKYKGGSAQIMGCDVGGFLMFCQVLPILTPAKHLRCWLMVVEALI